MFRIKNQKGSLALSLVATGAVAATIVATHQLTQRFASGAVANFGRQEAFLLAQRSLALAGLMVARNIVLCSNQPADGGSQVEGCNKIGPLQADKKALKFYDEQLKLKDDENDLFTIENNSSVDYAKKYLRFKGSGSGGHEIFKNAEIIWSLRKLDSSLRSISGSLAKGYVCRNKETFAVIDGSCDSLGERNTDEKLMSNRDSSLYSDKPCKNISNSVCDYYQETDGDDVVVFISVRVPYHSTASEEAEDGEAKVMTANAAVRRPMSIFKLYSTENKSVCPASCQLSKFENFPVCMSLGGERLTHATSNTSGSLSGKNYFPKADKIHAAKTEIKIKNYGPGVLYGAQFLKEDIYPAEGASLSRSVVGFKGGVEPTDSSENQEGIKSIVHYTPCYKTNFYRPGLQKFTCDCNPTQASDEVMTAGGTVCKKGKSACAGSSGNDKSIFASSAMGVLQDSHSKQEARDSLSKCQNFGGSEKLEAMANLTSTVYEKNCKDAGPPNYCDFTRIDDDQDTTPKESYCGHEYVAKSTHGYTGTEQYPDTKTSVFPNASDEAVLSAFSQSDIPISAGVLP